VLRFCLLLCPLICILLPAHVLALELRDDANTRLSIQLPITRIISLAPHTTELVYAAGADQHLVGVTAFSNFPAQAKTVPRVGNATRLDVERIIALQPDLILGWISGNSAQQIQQLRDAGLTVYMTEPDELEDIPRYLLDIGRASATTNKSTRQANSFLASLAVMQQRFANRDAVDVFIQVSESPLYTLNGEHIVSAALSKCGGRNVFADLPLLAPAVGLEAVIKHDPEVIFASVYPGAEIDISRWQRLPQLRAARLNNIYRVNADNVMRPTPRILQGVMQMCELLDTARQRRRQTLE